MQKPTTKVVTGEQVTHEATFGPSGAVLCNPILNVDLGQIMSNAFPAASVSFFIWRCRKMCDAGGCVTKLKGQYWRIYQLFSCWTRHQAEVPWGVCKPLNIPYHRKHTNKQGSNLQGEPKHLGVQDVDWMPECFRSPDQTVSGVSAPGAYANESSQQGLEPAINNVRWPQISWKEAQSNIVCAHLMCTRVGNDITPMPNHKFQISPSHSNSDTIVEVLQLKEKSCITACLWYPDSDTRLFRCCFSPFSHNVWNTDIYQFPEVT